MTVCVGKSMLRSPITDSADLPVAPTCVFMHDTDCACTVAGEVGTIVQRRLLSFLDTLG